MKKINSVQPNNQNLYAECGAMDMTVSREASKAGISGLEFLIGIPGTIGGGIKMNAGSYGGETSDILEKIITVNRNGKVKEYFILPTLVVDKTLKESNKIYHLGKKRDGSKRKVTSHRAIFLQESKDHYWCGWRRKWNKYFNNWDILEK